MPCHVEDYNHEHVITSLVLEILQYANWYCNFYFDYTIPIYYQYFNFLKATISSNISPDIEIFERYYKCDIVTIYKHIGTIYKYIGLVTKWSSHNV